MTVALLLTPLLHAAADLESRLEAAQYTERVAGDLKSALNQYNAILPHVGANRSLAAQVLMRIAQCEERLGRRDTARVTYQRIVNDYADQPESVAFAKQRLAAWTATPQGPRNLDFERGEAGWTGAPIEMRREGCRNRSGCAVVNGPAKLTQSFSAAAYRGKTVRLRAWLKTEDARGAGGALVPADRAQLSLAVNRANGEKPIIDNTDDRPVQSPQWTRCDVAGEIDRDAQSIELGLISSGTGRVWIDSVSFQIVPDAEIAASNEAIQKVYARSDSTYLDGTESAHRTTITALRLTGNGAIVTSRVEYIRSEANRTRSTTYVSTHRDTWLKEDTAWKLKKSRILTTRQVDSTTDAQTARRAAADLKQTAAPLATIEVGHTFYDLAPFGTAVGDARIVALGEATYGTREFFLIKHRLLEYLVKEKGFTVVAINVSYPEAIQLDLYIKSGEGDPKALLTGMLWPWNTEEALDVVEWMREYNKRPEVHTPLSFASFGISSASVVTPRVVDYLMRISPLDAVTAQTDYAPLHDMESRLGEVYDDAAGKAAEGADAVVKLLDAKRESLTQASSVAAWRDARQDAELARQAAAIRIAGKESAYGNEMMARNIEWLATDAHPGEKIVLWGHDERVGFTPGEAEKSLGTWLREEYGERLFVTGFAFHHGELLAIGVQNGQNAGVAKQTIPQSAEEDGDSVLSAAGMPVFFLDLRTVPPSSALGRWLVEPHSFLEVGALWNQDDPQSNWRVKTMSKSYDGLVFLEEGHAAHGL